MTDNAERLLRRPKEQSTRRRARRLSLPAEREGNLNKLTRKHTKTYKHKRTVTPTVALNHRTQSHNRMESETLARGKRKNPKRKRTRTLKMNGKRTTPEGKKEEHHEKKPQKPLQREHRATKKRKTQGPRRGRGGSLRNKITKRNLNRPEQENGKENEERQSESKGVKEQPKRMREGYTKHTNREQKESLRKSTHKSWRKRTRKEYGRDSKKTQSRRKRSPKTKGRDPLLKKRWNENHMYNPKKGTRNAKWTEKRRSGPRRDEPETWKRRKGPRPKQAI